MTLSITVDLYSKTCNRLNRDHEYISPTNLQ